MLFDILQKDEWGRNDDLHYLRTGEVGGVQVVKVIFDEFFTAILYRLMAIIIIIIKCKR